MRTAIEKIIESWKNTDGNVNTTQNLLSWIRELNLSTFVSVKDISIKDDSFWFYDDLNGEVLNKKRSFFSIKGLRNFEDKKFVDEKPMIFQPEIGYLGIICKEIDGVMNFLMQAKIEPGNINCIQISPTLQATKSNFDRVHGGNLPAYFEYFYHVEKYKVIYDQIQSEQGGVFYKKRNRNIIIEVTDEIEILPNFKWMTLGQIKSLMQIDNLVNMDTRTVLSGIPIISLCFEDNKEYISRWFEDKAFYNSALKANPLDDLNKIYRYINNYKMFHNVERVIVPLNQLSAWDIDEWGLTCREKANFEVRYYDINIEGREVRQWTQPLFKSIGKSLFGLIISEHQGCIKYLVSVKKEIGVFDKCEVGPSVQIEMGYQDSAYNEVERIVESKLKEKKDIILDVFLSEEGGRFYHEQNRNVIIKIADDELKQLPEGYFWVNYSTLNYMIQINNCLNIQLRNLLSLLKI